MRVSNTPSPSIGLLTHVVIAFLGEPVPQLRSPGPSPHSTLMSKPFLHIPFNFVPGNLTYLFTEGKNMMSEHAFVVWMLTGPSSSARHSLGDSLPRQWPQETLCDNLRHEGTV